MSPNPTRRLRLPALVATTALAASAGALVPAVPAAAAPTSFASTSRVSVTSAGVPSPIGSQVDDRTLIDSTGRFAFFSTTAKLQPDDTNNMVDVYVRDRLAGTTTRVSITDADAQIAGGEAHLCGVSDTGRYVGFVGGGTNLPGSGPQVYLRDRDLGSTELASLTSTGVPSGVPGAPSGMSVQQPCPISADGRYIAFATVAANVVPGDTNTNQDIFRRDRTSATTVRVSVASGGAQGNGNAWDPAMSDDGLVVAFHSYATTMVAGDTNSQADVFVRKPANATTARVSVRSDGSQTFGGDATNPSVSSTGRYVAFQSKAPDLTTDDETPAIEDVFVHDRLSLETELVSLGTDGQQGEGASIWPRISGDGRFVLFTSKAVLHPADEGAFDVFRRDRQLDKTELVSRPVGLGPEEAQSFGGSISDDGSVAAYTSTGSDIVRNDNNGAKDAFVWDRATDLTPFTTIDAAVQQQFVDFASRQPTTSELAEWRARLRNGELGTDGLIDSLAHSTAFSAKRAPLIRLYWAFFLRMPDLGGLNYWVGRLDAGTSLASVAKQFSQSSEFQTKYGTKTNSQFVTLIYQNILERDPDPGGLAYWTGKLDAKTKTRGDVMVNFSESSEGKRFLAPRVDVVLVHLGMLRTMPSKSFFDEASSQIALGIVVIQEVSRAIRVDGAYAARVTAST